MLLKMKSDIKSHKTSNNRFQNSSSREKVNLHCLQESKSERRYKVICFSQVKCIFINNLFRLKLTLKEVG